MSSLVVIALACAGCFDCYCQQSAAETGSAVDVLVRDELDLDPGCYGEDSDLNPKNQKL